MRERPILFSEPMVQAILRDQKTQTRRVMKIQPRSPAVIFDVQSIEPNSSLGLPVWATWPCKTKNKQGKHNDHGCKCPYGRVGDRLWVRETWADCNGENGPMVIYKSDNHHRFLVDESYPVEYAKYPGGVFSMWGGDLLRGADGHSWRSPIHMPRWASRITLEIVNVRVERLQDISDGDCRAEGINVADFLDGTRTSERIKWKSRFITLWNKINGKKHSWESNPYVWVYDFKRVKS